MIRALLLSGPLLAGLLLAGGCAKRRAAPAEAAASPAPKAAAKPESLNVATTAGSADRTNPRTGARLYTVAWKSAALTLAKSGIQEGRMNGVSGTVYEDGKPKSTYSAETGYARKASGDLRLEGRVVVKSPRYGSTLTARKLEWLPDVKRYRASGDVRVSGDWGVMGPADVLLATSDLKIVGTPENFPPASSASVALPR